MKREDLKKFSKIASQMDLLSKALCILQHDSDLFFISEHDLTVSFNTDCHIKIPSCLVQEFKQKLIDYYVEKYNEFVKTLNSIEL